jgi:uncharacterized protein (UPF0332 family)
MSPRSGEFMAKARSRLAAASDSLAAGHPDEALSLAYYAMLYAARAALSEEDRHAKTHAGTWSLFAETFVKPERFSPELYREARATEEDRLKGDYDAASFPEDRAGRAIDAAARFIDAIVGLIGE